MNQNILIILTLIGVITLLCQWLAWWVKLPAILFLLLVGIVFGSILNWFNPDEMFGQLLYPMVSMSVAIILFEGSLTLKFGELGEVRRIVRNLVTLGVLVTMAATAVLVHYIFNFSWQISALFGAITSVTGPTVITPMLRTIRPNRQIANILRWEGIMVDPIGALFAVLVFGFITSVHNEKTVLDILLDFSEMISVGAILGVASGYFLGVVLRRHWIPEFLHNVMTLTLVLAVFSLSDLMDDGAGLLAVTVMGIWLTNMKDVPVDDILGFKESLSILLISGLFIILASRFSFIHIEEVIWPGIGLVLLLQFVVRPLSVYLSSIGSKLTWQERVMIAWISPRGIVAAATAAIFTFRLSSIGFQQASYLTLITFLIIIGTVVFQSGTARALANFLGVSEPEQNGFLIIGANPVARMIGEALTQNNIQVTLTGMGWENIQAARMAGLNVYYGNAISEHADRHLDLVGIGGVLALSPLRNLNIVANLRYRREFGRNAVYLVQTADKKADTSKHAVSEGLKGLYLFDKGVTYFKLASMVSKGAGVRSTLITETFSYEEYQKQYEGIAFLLFSLDPKGNIHFFTESQAPSISSGWTIVSLVDLEKSPSSV